MGLQLAAAWLTWAGLVWVAWAQVHSLHVHAGGPGSKSTCHLEEPHLVVMAKT